MPPTVSVLTYHLLKLKYYAKSQNLRIEAKTGSKTPRYVRPGQKHNNFIICTLHVYASIHS